MSGPKKSGNWIVRLLLALLVLVAAGYLVRYLMRPVAQVFVAARGKAVRTVPGTVEVRSEFDIALKSEVSGRVKTSDLDVGKRVSRGDVLIVLDTGDVDLEIDRIHNEIEAAKRRLQIGSTLRAEEQNKTETLENIERQVRAGSYPQAEFEKEKRLLQQLTQRRELEEVKLKLDLDTLESQLRAKEREKSKMTIVAPADGEVTEVVARVGDLIGSNSTIATLISVGRTIVAKLSEDNFAPIKLGQPATVRFLTFGNEQYNATISKILPAADATTQRYSVFLDVALPEGRTVMPGLTGEVIITIAERADAVIVPRRALVGEYIYVVDGGSLDLRKVEKGYESLNRVEILKGVQAGDAVLVEQQDRFRSGDRVRTKVLEN